MAGTIGIEIQGILCDASEWQLNEIIIVLLNWSSQEIEYDYVSVDCHHLTPEEKEEYKLINPMGQIPGLIPSLCMAV